MASAVGLAGQFVGHRDLRRESSLVDGDLAGGDELGQKLLGRWRQELRRYFGPADLGENVVGRHDTAVGCAMDPLHAVVDQGRVMDTKAAASTRVTPSDR